MTDITIKPGRLCGTVAAIPSKSQAHRLLICAAFADKPTNILCDRTNRDIDATAECLRALGAEIRRTETGFHVTPITKIPDSAILPCGESGSTLRFLLPVAGALGVNATFLLEGRLPQRPLSPLWEEMERMGCSLFRPTANTVACSGRLRGGDYQIDGSVSSQFITGLLFALALIEGNSTLSVTGKLESKPYVDMTLQALSAFGVGVNEFDIGGSYPFRSLGTASVEGDWSNAAFFLAATRIGSHVTVTGLSGDSVQGDRAVLSALQQMDSHCTIDASDIPDLVPILAVAAGALNGATFTNIGRLRLKESDRVATVAAMLQNLGASVEVTQDTLTVYPAAYRSCAIDAHGDHRIAMAAAIAATAASGPVTILGAQCVAKSYPTFWEEYRKLGGNYEQYVR